MAELPHLQGVLNDKLIEVADYQRPYAWGEKQLKDLWQDLDLLGSDRHYAGTLVLQRTDRTLQSTDGEELTVYEVVDGQQRLTTSLILLEQLRKALRDLADTSQEEVNVDGAYRDLTRLIRVDINGVSVPRLRLGADLNDFFDKTVLGNDAPDKVQLVAGEQRLASAAKFFRTAISGLIADADPVEAARRLVELRARVCFRLRFLVYDVESNAEVGVLFETLNDRGQSLSDLEKVKNYLLYLSRQLPTGVEDHLTTTINKAWSDIFANLARLTIDDDALLRAHWIATEDPIQRNWQRTISVKAKFPRAQYVPSSGRLAGTQAEELTNSDELATALLNEVTTYVESLRKCSAFLRDIYDERAAYEAFDNEKLGDEVRLRSAALVRTGSIANFRALLLAARLKYPTDGEVYLRLVELCEKFSARAYVICVARSNAGQSTLHWAAHRLHSGVDPELVIAEITTKLLQLAPDEAVRANFGSPVEWYYRRSHKYVLYEYELHLARTGSEIPTFGDLTNGATKTTEHVLPQTPSANSQWKRDFSSEQHASLLNTIGNLVLTRDNSAYSNKDYVAKRGEPGQDSPRCYLSPSALASEREIAQKYESWVPASIETRRARIEEWAVSRWHIDAPAIVTETPDDEDGLDPREDAPEDWILNG